MGAETIRVALDWTPNTIHSGLYIALEKGLYKDRNLDVKLLEPDSNYSTTPAKQLQNGEADLAIVPSESCIAYNETNRMKLQAVYAILQRDASAIVSIKHQTIAALDGGTYGSYNAKYEDHIVRAMVSAGGGKGENMKVQNATQKLSLFDELREGNLDATWIFVSHEGVEAELAGFPLYAFKAEDAGIPYGYSPVIARNAARSSSALSGDTLRRFLAATATGYEYAQRDHIEAAAILAPRCRPERSTVFLNRSQARINEYYGDGSGKLGWMQPERWQAWTDWLRKQGLLQKDLRIGDLFTNEFVG